MTNERKKKHTEENTEKHTHTHIHPAHASNIVSIFSSTPRRRVCCARAPAVILLGLIKISTLFTESVEAFSSAIVEQREQSPMLLAGGAHVRSPAPSASACSASPGSTGQRAKYLNTRQIGDSSALCETKHRRSVLSL